MKIALLIRGIVSLENYIHHTGKVYNLNYKNNLQNIKEKIIEPLAIHQVDLYISTQTSKNNENVLNDFKPFKHIFLPKDTNQNQNLLAGLEIIEENYDFVIITRFDIHLKQEITKLDFDCKKFNILWNEQTKDHRISDCLHFFNYEFIHYFKKALIDCPHKKCIHHIKPYLLKYMQNEDIRILYDSYYDSNSDKMDNPVYKIQRGDVIADLSNSFWNKYLGNKKLQLVGLL